MMSAQRRDFHLSPLGRGRAVTAMRSIVWKGAGEGALFSSGASYLLTPALSPWERRLSYIAATTDGYGGVYQ